VLTSDVQNENIKLKTLIFQPHAANISVCRVIFVRVAVLSTDNHKVLFIFWPDFSSVQHISKVKEDKTKKYAAKLD
jgi:hypothetical protein